MMSPLPLINKIGFRSHSYDSFLLALKSLIRFSSVPTGMQIHSLIIRIGFLSDLPLLSALITFYSSSSSHLSHARNLFDAVPLPSRHLHLWNSMLASYSKLGQMDSAHHLFDSMPLTKRNVVSWTTLISGYARINRPHRAIAIFRNMQLHNVRPDEVALLAALSACSQLGALELGQWIHNYIHNHHRLLRRNYVPLNNALIDMYSKSGDINKALHVFQTMENKTIVTWTTMIAGLALHGLGTQALQFFSRMEVDRVKPNHVTFIAVLSACAHVGLVQTGKSVFNSMTSRYGIQPKIEHYGCMVDLLGRAGCFQEAQQLLQQMPFEPNAAIWGSLLAASYTHGDATLGELALQHLIKLEPNNSGNYALLSNLYASLGRWKASRVVRKMMRNKGIKKMPGGSFIEVNDRVNEFIAGETSHTQFVEIFKALCMINEQLKIPQLLENECLDLAA